MSEGEAKQARGLRKERRGLVVSRSGNKSIVIRVERSGRHPVYGKVVSRACKYHAHDEANAAGVGDFVRIAETRPLSKMKRWRLVEVIAAAARKEEAP